MGAFDAVYITLPILSPRELSVALACDSESPSRSGTRALGIYFPRLTVSVSVSPSNRRSPDGGAVEITCPGGTVSEYSNDSFTDTCAFLSARRDVRASSPTKLSTE